MLIEFILYAVPGFRPFDNKQNKIVFLSSVIVEKRLKKLDRNFAIA